MVVDHSVIERFWLLLDEGWSLRAASLEVGVHPGTGSKWVKLAGLSRPSGRRLTGDDGRVVTPGGVAPSVVAREAGLLTRSSRRVEVVELVRGGMTVAAAARQVGMTPGGARVWVDRAGVVPVTAEQRRAQALEEARVAREQARMVVERARLVKRDQVLGLIRSGMGHTAAAKMVGVGVVAARDWATQAGLVVGRDAQAVVRDQFWVLWRQGLSVEQAATRVGVHPNTVRRWLAEAGLGGPMGRPVADRGVATGGRGCSWQDTPVNKCLDSNIVSDVVVGRGFRLSVEEREEIALCRFKGMGVRQIAKVIDRPPSTVSRELKRNSGPDGKYRVLHAQKAARQRATRSKTSKLAQEGPLRDYVQNWLNNKLSPEQISNRLRLEHPNNPEMYVCHETIYQALYMEARGGLKREVEQALRHGRAYRKPRRKEGERRGRIPGMVPIAARPEDIEERRIPGHWEGDLIIGKDSASAVATLVERRYRYVMLAHLDGDHTANTVRDALVGVLAGLPDQLRRTLTWDQGSEMACHIELTDLADIEIYFADPHSPWQRGTNENTNGLLRQYLPKGTDLSVYTQEDLQTIADQLNNRPRKTLGWLTPNEAMHLDLGHTVIIGGQPAKLPDNLLPLAQRCVDN